MEEQGHQVSLMNRPQTRLLVVLPLLVLAFVSKIWYTVYLAFSFILLFLIFEWSELGVKTSGLRGGFRRTWHFFVLSLIVTPPIVWFLINRYLLEFWIHVFGRVEFIGIFQTLAATVIIIPFMEEVIFLGLVQEQLSWLTNDPTALIVSSVIFAAVHWNPGVPLVVGVDLFLVFLDSLWFGVIYMKSRNTVLSTFCHSFGNLIFILYGTLVVGMVV